MHHGFRNVELLPSVVYTERISYDRFGTESSVVRRNSERNLALCEISLTSIYMHVTGVLLVAAVLPL